MHERHVLDGVERRHIGVAGERPDCALHRKLADPLDQLVAGLTVGDEIGDRDLLELVALGKGGHARAAHHGAVVVHQLGKHADRRQPRETTQVDAGFGMSGAHQHAAVLGNQREDVARPHEITGAHIAVGERAHGIGPLFRRDPRGEPVTDIDRNRKRRAERRVVRRHHGIEMEALGLFR